MLQIPEKLTMPASSFLSRHNPSGERHIAEQNDQHYQAAACAEALERTQLVELQSGILLRLGLIAGGSLCFSAHCTTVMHTKGLAAAHSKRTRTCTNTHGDMGIPEVREA